MKKLCLACARILLIVAAGLVAAPGNTFAATPAETLEHIGNAIDNGDAAAFEELVDVDALLDDCLTVFLREARKPENASRMPPLLAIMFTQAGTEGAGGQRLRALLKSEAKSFVRNGISSGAFAGKKLTGVQASGVLAPLFADASLGRKELRGIGEPQRDGEGWLVPFSVHDYGNEQDYQITGRFSPLENGWRMTGIENLENILQQIYQESQGLADKAVN